MTALVLLLSDAGSPGLPPAWLPTPKDDQRQRSAVRGRVLVVEDDAMVRSYLARVLREHGHSVELAANGAEGWRLAVAAPAEFDLVITDVRMPVMDGWQLGRQLRERWPGLPVLYLSGYDLEQASPSAAMFLRKPFDPDELIRRVTQLLGKN
jgi:two-component system cell cycle sensor histidine kinase/response regulator CckA